MLSSFANFVVPGKRSDRFHGLLSYRVEARAVTQDAPRGAGQLVGQGNRGLVPGHSGYGAFEPGSEAERLPSVGAHHDHLGGLHEEHAQVSTSALGDPSQDRAATRAELSGHQPNPGREVAAPVEGHALSNRRDHGRRNHRPDRPEADHALTLKPDHSAGAGQALEKDSYECRVCGNFLEEWNASTVPTFRLIARPNGA